MKNIWLSTALVVFTGLYVYAGKSNPLDSLKAEIDTVSPKNLNWYNLDPEDDFMPGVGTERAYKELAKKRRKAGPVVVAILDTGVDTTHEDLRGKFWVNTGEIPGNKKDDDGNGYIDDIHGWNFLGNEKGENIFYENLELTRLYKEYSQKYRGKDINGFSPEEKKGYKFFKNLNKKYWEDFNKSNEEIKKLDSFIAQFEEKNNLVKENLKKDTVTIEDLELLKTGTNEDVANAAGFILNLKKNGFDIHAIQLYKKAIGNEMKYYLDTTFNGRAIIGDDPFTDDGSVYGNSDVNADTSGHGTHVAGIVAANRNNAKGIKGICNDARIMILRVVPEGDERDKDIARAIRYAADNGAKIINMSFGKVLSPQKKLVDDAAIYAASKGVLLVHAAGNDAVDIDKITHYPSAKLLNSKTIDNWVTVGASGSYRDERLVGNFSNYGKKNVDIFAPGVSIYSLKSGGGYITHSGTSMACPVFAGVAALLMSHYPELSTSEIKQILLNSNMSFKSQKVIKPQDGDKKPKKVKFSKLSATGGIVNAYKAVLEAEQLLKQKSSKN